MAANPQWGRHGNRWLLACHEECAVQQWRWERRTRRETQVQAWRQKEYAQILQSAKQLLTGMCGCDYISNTKSKWMCARWEVVSSCEKKKSQVGTGEMPRWICVCFRIGGLNMNSLLKCIQRSKEVCVHGWVETHTLSSSVCQLCVKWHSSAITTIAISMPVPRSGLLDTPFNKIIKAFGKKS